MFRNGIINDNLQHTKPIIDLKWSCDGLYLLSISFDKTIKLHILDNSNNLKLSQNINYSITPTNICWHPTNPTRYVIISDDKNIDIFDVKSSTPIIKLISLGNNINVSWSPDGKFLAVANKSDYLLIFEISTGKQLKKYKFNYEVNEFAWSALSDYILFAGATQDGGSIEIINFTSNNNNYNLNHIKSEYAHTSTCCCLKIDPSYSYIAIGSNDFLISIWDLREGCICINTITVSDSAIKCISFNGTGEYLIFTNENCQTYICHILTGEVMSTIDLKSNLLSVAWNPYKNIIALAPDNKPLSNTTISIDTTSKSFGNNNSDSISTTGMNAINTNLFPICQLTESEKSVKIPTPPSFLRCITF